MNRKTLSIILALALIIGLVVPAMAAEPTVISSITIAHPQNSDFHITLTNVYDRFEWYYYSDMDDVPPGTRFFLKENGTITINREVEVDYLIDGYAWDALEYEVGEPFTIPYGAIATSEYDEEKTGAINFFGYSCLFYIYGVENTRGLGHAGVFGENLYDPGNENAEDIRTLAVGAAAIPPAEQPSTWAAELVNAAIAADLVPQTLRTKYTQPTTRAEFAALAVTLYENVTGKEIATTRSLPFTDTTDINAIKAAAIGVTTGTGDGTTFSPDLALTREQAATMLSRLAEALEKPLPDETATFADVASVSTWAVEAVGQMQTTGVMGGVGENKFAPKEAYTREQSIMTIMRLYEIVS